MTLPTLKVECAFQNDPRATPVWTDITQYVQRVSIRRGRQHELDRFEAGEASVVVDNRSGYFHPLNTASPFYPYVIPTRRVQISGMYGSVQYPLFTGYVEAWPQDHEGFSDYFGEITLVDAFKVLALDRIIASLPMERSDVRVNHILDLCTWTTGGNWILEDATYGVLGTTTILGPNVDRLITIGQSTMVAEDIDVMALQHLQEVQESENGLMFITKEGAFLFKGRHSRLNPPYTEIQVYVGDDPDAYSSLLPYGGHEFPYVSSSLKLSYDDTNLWNTVGVDGDSGNSQWALDALSRTQHYPRVKTRSIKVADDNEALDCANWLLALYKDPKMRADEVMMDGEFNPPVLWPLIMQRELSDRIQLRARQVTTGGSTILLTQDCFIEQMTYDIDCEESPTWDVAWALSPAVTTTYWILDDPVASSLGVTTRLCY